MSELKYDPTTGQITLDSLSQAEEHRIASFIADATDVEAMKATRGYELLTKFLSGMIDQSLVHLTDAKDITEVVRLQEIVKSYKSISLWVDYHLEASRHLQEQALSDKNPTGA